MPRVARILPWLAIIATPPTAVAIGWLISRVL